MLVVAAQTPALARNPNGIDSLLRAYPEDLQGFDGENLIWRDGTRMPVGPEHPADTLAQAIRGAAILDMFRSPYPRGSMDSPPTFDADPGRVRDRAFFAKMYGDCRRGEVEPRLVPIIWLQKTWGHAVRVTSVNGVARHLEAVSREIDDMPAAIKRFAWPLGGTYTCRAVADTGEPSLHGAGAAIDINVALSDYWFWRRSTIYVNRIPPEIVAAFERHGFIWGGKWFHFDTMHFEYRPELLGLADSGDE
jgi:hypothetical protein